MTKMDESSQACATARTQTVQSFGYQWTRLPEWSMAGDAYAQTRQWVLDKYGWKTVEGLGQALSRRRRILDVGCGQGRELLLFSEANPQALVVGLEPSEAVRVARRTIAPASGRVRVIHGDLFETPFVNGSFDFIFANGVLHHTRSTRDAFARCRQLLSNGGELAAYIYRKKAPLREYADDYLRAIISRLPPKEAWETCRGLTELGQQLSDLCGEIELARGVPLLGIQPGRHQVQRLLYNTMLKMFWDQARGFEGSTLVNFDWYHPAFAWRHTLEEITQWCAEFGLGIIWLREEEAGMTIRAIASSPS